MAATNLKALLQSFGDPLAHHAAAVHAQTIGATRWTTVLAGTDPATRTVNQSTYGGTEHLVTVTYVRKAEVTDIYNTALAQGRAPSLSLYNAALAEAGA